MTDPTMPDQGVPDERPADDEAPARPRSANGLTEGQTVVTIPDSDVAFETQSCGEWTKV